MWSKYDPHEHLDMEMRDLQDIHDYFLWYGSSDSDKVAAENMASMASMFPNMKFVSLNETSE